MSRIINRAESWETAYEAFQTVNFSAFDYDTIKQSMIDYIKTYFPEDFNDYIESSEFIALLELFAYLGELVAYRLDLNAHENFLSTAQRKESVLRLAKLISYSPSRNIPNRGLVKLTSITTTEHVYDSNGIDLSNKKIIWNDANNSSWKEQFLLVMNQVLEQDFGTVSPNERVQVDDVLFELYTLNNNTITNGVFKYSASVSGESLPMELVPSDLNEYGPLEKRPDVAGRFSILYGSDGLGDGSDTTGFFAFTKQGTLQKVQTTFDGTTPNQTYDILINDINETDVWVNNVDPTDETILDDGTSTEGRSGEWQEVDLAHAQNIIFNTNPNRNKYEVETLADDNIRLIFGDGEFADIPSGSFDIWVRSSVNDSVVIPRNVVINKKSSFTYQDSDNNVQTFSFTFSLINSLQNNSPSEDIDHIRNTAPAVYYSQDRMVNNRDYNTFMLQDSTILKLRAVNRTFAGDSKYIAWHDPSETYENVKLFGDDLALYFYDETTTETADGTLDATAIVTDYLEPLLSSTAFFFILTQLGVPASSIRSRFYYLGSDPWPTEKDDLITELGAHPAGTPIDLYFSVTNDLWDAVGPGEVLITVTTPDPSGDNVWIIEYADRRLIAESEATRFWNTNDAARVISYDTLLSSEDKIVVLKANTKDDETSVLSQNWNFNILGQQLFDGLESIHHLSVLPEDTTNDSVPDNVTLDEIIDPTYVVTSTGSTSLPFVAEYQDITLDGDVDASYVAEYWYDGAQVVGPISTDLIDEVVITSLGSNTQVTIDVVSYVYFMRASTIDDWLPQETTADAITAYNLDQIANPDPVDQLWKREHGRYPLNFAWFHNTSQFHLVDPSATNIIDIFIITRGYYTSLTRWLNGTTSIEPDAPTPLELRNDYGSLLDNRMISDTVILHSGNFKLLFGSKATPQLRATFKVVRSATGSLTDNQVKVKITQIVDDFFDVNDWEFGETFYFTELAASIHSQLSSEIDTVVLVPTYGQNQFGDLFQVYAREDEILQPDISVSNIEIVESLNSQNLRQNL